MADPERERLEAVPSGRSPWRRWGPYVSERAWGTVREDCDDRQTLCLALACWTGLVANLVVERGLRQTNSKPETGTLAD